MVEKLGTPVEVRMMVEREYGRKARIITKGEKDGKEVKGVRTGKVVKMARTGQVEKVVRTGVENDKFHHLTRGSICTT